MSLQVFFDNTLIDEKYYTGLTNNFELFSDNFKLGATPSNTYKLNIAKEGVSSQPSSVILKDSGTTFANLNIDNTEEQDYTYDYTLTDKMIDLDFNYDASEIFVDDKTTLLAIAQDICTKVGLTLGTNNFRGYNKEITWYDNRKTARQYIGYIAELNGGFARIENNTLYFRKQKTNSINTISIDDCENFNIGEYHKITRVVYELGALKYEYGDETGNTLYLDSENVFITEQSEVQAIYNDIKNFEFYSFETSNCPINYNVKAGDVITFTDGTNNYLTIAQYDLEYFGGWTGGYSLSVATKRQEETQVIGTKEHVKNLQIIVDRDTNRIDEIVETTIPEIEEQIEVITDTTGTGTGKFIHLDDCSDQPFNSIVMNGETSQNGTPSTDNRIEIKNADGKNKFSGWVKGVGLNGTTGEETTWSSAASSGYIPVNFNSSPNYYLSGATDTLPHWVGAYNAQKQFLGRTGGTYSKTRALNANSFTSGTPQGTGDIAYLRATQYVGSGDTATIDAVDNLQTQLEEGTVPTQFVPFDSLEIKVNNENLLNITATSTTTHGLTFTINPDKSIKVNGTNTSSETYFFKIANNFILPAGDYTLSNGNTNVSNTNGFIFYDDNSNFARQNISAKTFTTEKIISPYIKVNAGVTVNNQIIYPMIVYGTYNEETIPDYENNEHQTAYFPLQGEKLMQGDYIDSQGIHHKKRQVVYDGSSDEGWTLWANEMVNVTRFAITHHFNNYKTNPVSEIVCSHFKYENSDTLDAEHIRWGGNNETNIIIYVDKSKATTVAELRQLLASSPMTIEYELEEYDLTPFTTDQQKAWDEISLLTTYKRITNILSDASLDIEYLKDNGLDVYETRSSAEVTKSQVSRLTIEEERIASEVSSTKSSLTNYYTKDESDASMQSTKDELNNIISQNKTEAEQTAEQIALRISSIETNGTNKVQTTTGYTFDDEGLKIDKTGAVTSSVIDNEAFKVTEKSTDEEVFFAGYVSDQNSDYRGQTIVKSTNLVVKNYLNIEGASRFQPYTNPVLGGHGTGAFDIG